MQPQFADETPINPFDFWQGANFKLKIVKKDGYWNYDKSEFAAPGTLAGLSDSELEAIWKTQYSLKEFTDEGNFKTYEELEARLNMVLNSVKKTSRRVDSETEEDEGWSPATSTSTAFSTRKESSWNEEVSSFKNTSVAAVAETEDDEDKMSYFARLAEED
jgi:hypothetical protein